MKDELIDHDAVALGELVRKREFTSTELIDLAIERIERINPKLNAVIHKLYDQARAAAAVWDSDVKAGTAIGAVFCGVPFLIKDLVAEYQGAPFHEGSRAVKGYVSKQDSELVRRQKASGLVIVAKTNTPEFGAMPTTEPVVHGPTANPWDPRLTPGGSSGGSAAAVAAGIVPMAHGNDGGGSIRIPASCCGLFGLKPTRARNPLGPLFGDMISGLVHEHAVTRSVRDSAALLDATSGPDIGDPYHAPHKERPFLEEVGQSPGRLKIGFISRVPDGWFETTEVHPDCADAVKDAAHLCSSLGHRVEEVPGGELRQPGLPRAFNHMFSCYLGHAVAYWERELGRKIDQQELEPVTWNMYQAGLKGTGADYLVTVEEIQRFSRKIARWFHDGKYDVLLSPTMRIPPTRLGELDWPPADFPKWRETVLSFGAFAYAFNLTGQPAASVPLFWNRDGIPIGAQFVGRFGDEATLFRLAAQLERERPWAHRRPRIHAAALP